MQRSKALEGVLECSCFSRFLLHGFRVCLLACSRCSSCPVVFNCVQVIARRLLCVAMIEAYTPFISPSGSLIQKSMTLKLKDRDCFFCSASFLMLLYLARRLGLSAKRRLVYKTEPAAG